MIWQVRHAPPTLLACLLLFGGPPAAGQETGAAAYNVRPSDVAVPEDAELGRYQRIVRPFANWTLICDENLATREMVCNVTQVIEDRNGVMVFSWSLAATRDGDPYMILRTAPSATSQGLISLRFQGRDQPVDVHIDGCNDTVCVGMLPVGPILREQIANDAAPEISYQTADGSTISVAATLAGLSEALAAVE